MDGSKLGGSRTAATRSRFATHPGVAAACSSSRRSPRAAWCAGDCQGRRWRGDVLLLHPALRRGRQPGAGARRELRQCQATDGGWFEHQFGGRPLDEAEQAPATDARGYAVNAYLQLDGGMDVTLSLTFDMTSGAVIDGSAVVVDAEGGRTWYDGDGVLFEDLRPGGRRGPSGVPNELARERAGGGLDLQLNASFDDQELITLLSQPSFWEGRVSASGECAGRDVSGVGFLQRRGFQALCCSTSSS